MHMLSGMFFINTTELLDLGGTVARNCCFQVEKCSSNLSLNSPFSYPGIIWVQYVARSVVSVPCRKRERESLREYKGCESGD